MNRFPSDSVSSSSYIVLLLVCLLTEERWGGLWKISAENSFTTPSSCLLGTDEWSLMTPLYSLGNRRSRLRALVDWPRPMGRSPETGGSRVPLCPAFSTPRSFLVQATTSWLVGPRGLSRGMRPYSSIASTGRADGDQPNFGSVGSSSRTTMLPGMSVPSVLHVLDHYLGDLPLVYGVGLHHQVEGLEVPSELDPVDLLV